MGAFALMAGKGGAGRKKPVGRKTPGSGGNRRRGLEGKGPTPPARERTGHPARKRAVRASRSGTAGAGRTRPSDGQEIVVGRNSVVEALRAGVPATALLVALRIDNDDRVHEAIKLAANRGIPLLEAARSELDRITGGAVHQGLALRMPDYEYAHPDDLVGRAAAFGQVPLLVVLDGVTDPRNLGAVARSAAAFGGHGLVVPTRRSAGVTAGAWKTSAGALASIPVARATNLTRAVEAYREAGLFVVGLDGSGPTEIATVELLTGPLVLVLGSEGRGLSRLVRESCDLLARIPMTAAAESLNAGVAAGIALYEVARHRSS